MRPLYTLLHYLLIPLILTRMLWRSRAIAAYRQRLPERFGWVRRSDQPIAVWVHAVSVGETLTAVPMVEALLKIHGDGCIWFTTGTPTGSERVIAAFGARVHHSYLPYDLPDAVARFLNRVRPAQVVVMETELWPNLFAALRRRNIPLRIVNARLSPRSFRGYSRFASFTASVLRDVALVAAQSEADADRFRSLGAPQVENVGNLKFDITPPSQQIDAGQRLREAVGGSRPVWAAVSTHDGEEAVALAVHQQLLQTMPDTLLILVPRHPQRFDAVDGLLRSARLRYARRSQFNKVDTVPDDLQVLLGDSLGEMWMYLRAANLAFVGGSLVPVGGHNVMEPVALGKPVLFGTRMHNFQHARDALLEAGAAVEVQDQAALRIAVADLLQNADRRTQLARAADKVAAANRGALARTLRLLNAPNL
ncbi:MAG: lipid IV(A) 3-deoxy-D-manno-octulosonic acid transferase [Panacagrimonas sp.]